MAGDSLSEDEEALALDLCVSDGTCDEIMMG